MRGTGRAKNRMFRTCDTAIFQSAQRYRGKYVRDSLATIFHLWGGGRRREKGGKKREGIDENKF
jgi:hypothetical protein